MGQLTFQGLQKIVRGDAAAIRRTVRLQPTAGEGEKVFPPTYAGQKGAVYATEVRRRDAGDVNAVLLDSVQSQANRMELALLRGYEEGKLKLPMMAIDFSGVAGAEDVGRVTLLELPHRIADAAARDSLYKGEKFRNAFDWHKATAANATPLFRTCPQALVFGVWDSMGSAGGLGTKFARALVSEIIAYGVQQGARPAGKLDPLTTGKVDAVFFQSADGTLTLNESEAVPDKSGKIVPVKKLSEMGYGYVTPGVANEEGIPHHGGVTFDYAIQTTVLSLNALRRLRFPVGGERTAERDLAAQVTLAGLALAAIAWQEKDYFLRSRCDLAPVEGMEFEVVGSGDGPFTLTKEGAAATLNEAAAEAVKLGLEWPEELVLLEPNPALQKVVVRSRELRSGE